MTLEGSVLEPVDRAHITLLKHIEKNPNLKSARDSFMQSNPEKPREMVASRQRYIESLYADGDGYRLYLDWIRLLGLEGEYWTIEWYGR